MAKTSGIVVVGVVLLALIVIMGAYAMFHVNQTALGGTTSVGGNPAQSVITSSTVISATGFNSQYSGTSVSPSGLVSTENSKFPGQFFSTPFVSGTTVASQGSVLDLLLNASGYHTAYVKGSVVPASTTDVINVPMNQNGTVTLTLLDNSGIVSGTLNNGASNITAAAGAALSIKAHMQGTDGANTQDMQCIVEESAGQNVSKITLDGAVAVSTAKPNWYTTLGANSAVYVFNIAPIVGSATADHAISIQSLTQKTLAGSEYKFTCYTNENFLDSQTGQVAYGVTDSLGNLKSIAAYPAVGYFS